MPLIEIDGLWKGFVHDVMRDRRSLAGQLWRDFWGSRSTGQSTPQEKFWALQDISARVERGRVLGIIGHNGAGKTTLLKVLTGELPPDIGRVVQRGKAVGLIDLTAGFDSALTGRENIYVRGGFLGFSRKQMAMCEAEIVSFADIGDFIDAPIGTYSQGMRMRLGFAITTMVDADIMIIDEILAVGDFNFHNKCMAKMNELRPKRATVLVSHGMEMIVQFCDECIVLDRGRVAFCGEPVGAVDFYRKLEYAKMRIEADEEVGIAEASTVSYATVELDAPNQESLAEQAETNVTVPNVEGALDPHALSGALRGVMGDFIYNQAALFDVSHHWRGPEGADRSALLTISFTPLRRIERLVVGVPIWTASGVMMTGFGSQGRNIQQTVLPGVPHKIEMIAPRLPFNRGVYYPVLAVQDGTEYIYRWPIEPLQVHENDAPFVWGLVTIQYDWRQTIVAEHAARQG